MEEKIMQNEYRTGDTRPPKNYRGVVSFLLVAVILLCGICSGLSVMNIHLMQQLNQQEQTFVEFSGRSVPTPASVMDEAVHPGFTGQSVSAFWQTFSDLPEGVYITRMEHASAAYAAGLRAGDVVMCIDGKPVSDMDTLAQYLCSQNSCAVAVQLYRNGQYIALDVDLEED